MDVFFIISFFRFHPGLKKSFEHYSIRNNLFLNASLYWDDGLSLGEMNQNFKSGATFGYGDAYLNKYFVTPKFSPYTQNYMKLLKQCVEIVTKILTTVTWLDEDQVHVRLVTSLDYSFAFT